MLDHFGFMVSDLKKSETFYGQCLIHLDLQIIERHGESAFVIARSSGEEFPFLFIGTGRPSFWNDKHQPSMSPVHLCFKAPSKESVDLFYKSAMESGGRDNGAPGERDPGFYAAYVIDPDGNNIEAGHRE